MPMLDGLVDFSARVLSGVSEDAADQGRYNATLAGATTKVQRLDDGSIAPIQLFDGSTAYGRYYNQAAFKAIHSQMATDFTATMQAAANGTYAQDPDGLAQFGGSWIDKSLEGLPEAVRPFVRDDLAQTSGEIVNRVRGAVLTAKRKNELEAILGETDQLNQAVLGYAAAGDLQGMNRALAKIDLNAGVAKEAYGDLIDIGHVNTMVARAHANVFAGQAVREIDMISKKGGLAAAYAYAESIKSKGLPGLDPAHWDDVAKIATADVDRRLAIQQRTQAQQDLLARKEGVTYTLMLGQKALDGSLTLEDLTPIKARAEALQSPTLAGIYTHGLSLLSGQFHDQTEKIAQAAHQQNVLYEAADFINGVRDKGIPTSPVGSEGEKAQTAFDMVRMSEVGNDQRLLNPANPDNHRLLLQDAQQIGLLPSATVTALRSFNGLGEKDGNTIAGMATFWRDLFMNARGTWQAYHDKLGPAGPVLDEVAKLYNAGSSDPVGDLKYVRDKQKAGAGGDGTPPVLRQFGQTPEAQAKALEPMFVQFMQQEANNAASLITMAGAGIANSWHDAMAQAAEGTGVNTFGRWFDGTMLGKWTGMDFKTLPLKEHEKTYNNDNRVLHQLLRRNGALDFLSFTGPGVPQIPTEMMDELTAQAGRVAASYGGLDGDPAAVVRDATYNVMRSWAPSRLAGGGWRFAKQPAELMYAGQAPGENPDWIAEDLVAKTNERVQAGMTEQKFEAHDELVRGNLFLTVIPGSTRQGGLPAYAVNFIDTHGTLRQVPEADGSPWHYRPSWLTSPRRQQRIEEARTGIKRPEETLDVGGGF